MKKSNQYFPSTGKKPSEILDEMRNSREKDFQWRQGKMFGFVYYPGDEIAETLELVYKMYMHDSRLNPTAFLSLRNMENEIVAMAGDLLHGNKNVTGSVTAGGTESILMAMKVARDWRRLHSPVAQVEVVAPLSAHPAFEKAAQYLGIKLVYVSLCEDYRVNVKEMEAAINENTAMLVASAPNFPYGVVDPVREIALLAEKNKLLCHVDACLGGFMLPFVEDLGYPVPEFDFRVKGVSSISADAHKYGYSAKGASIILYRSPELRKLQFFVSTEWPGGIFASQALLGSRGGGSLASAWAVIKLLGFEGYRNIAKTVIETTKNIQAGIIESGELEIVGNPEMSVFAFKSKNLNIYEIGDEMAKKGWLLDRLQNPSCLHLTISKIQTGIEKDFLKDLLNSVEIVRKHAKSKFKTKLIETAVSGISGILPEETFKKLISLTSRFIKTSGDDPSGATALYGITANIKNKGNVKELILSIFDRMYRIS